MSQKEPIRPIDSFRGAESISALSDAQKGSSEAIDLHRFQQTIEKKDMVPRMIELYDTTSFSSIKSDIIHHLTTHSNFKVDSNQLISFLGRVIDQVTPDSKGPFIYALMGLAKELSDAVASNPTQKKALLETLQFTQDNTFSNSFLKTYIGDLIAQLNMSSASETAYAAQVDMEINPDETKLTREEMAKLGVTADDLFGSAKPVIAMSRSAADGLEVAKPMSEGFKENVSFDPSAKSVSGQDKNIQIIQDMNRLIVSLAATTGAWAQALAGHRQGIASAIVDVGAGPQLIMAPPIEFLIGRMGKIRQSYNLYRFAIVVDSVASITDLEQTQNLRFIVVDENLNEERFVQLYQDLVNEGFRRIISIHVSHTLGPSYELAKKAAQSVQDVEVTVINSHANGLGLGLMLREAQKGMDQHFSPTDIDHLIHYLSQSLQYWVIPFSFNYQKNQRWLRKVATKKDSMKLRMFNYNPLICIKDSMKILSSYYDNEKAVNALIDRVEEAFIKRRHRIKSIGIEHRGMYREAKDLRNRLKVRCRGQSISIFLSGSMTSSHFGPQLLGVCII